MNIYIEKCHTEYANIYNYIVSTCILVKFRSRMHRQTIVILIITNDTSPFVDYEFEIIKRMKRDRKREVSLVSLSVTWSE